MTEVAFGRLPPDTPLLHDPAVRAALALLDRDGEHAQLVGGAVRNAVIEQAPGDIDVATTALPDVVLQRAQAAGIKAVPTGIEHGTVTLVVDGRPVEVTTLREDVSTDGRRATVAFGRDFAHDALRRDFTINALYASLDGTITDFTGGLADLAARKVRFIGDARTRIREDYLRILRLFRFHASYGQGAVDPQALAAATRLQRGLARLSAERIRAELLKLLGAPRAAATLPAMAEAGILLALIGAVPDLAAFSRLASSGPVDPVLGLAVLAARIREDGERLGERLRLSRAEAGRIERAASLEEGLHGRLGALDAQAARRLAFRAGAEAARDALVLAACRAGIYPYPPSLAEAAMALDAPLPPTPFPGRAVMARGIQPGPRLGAICARAERDWADLDFPTDPAVLDDILAAAIRAEPEA